MCLRVCVLAIIVSILSACASLEKISPTDILDEQKRIALSYTKEQALALAIKNISLHRASLKTATTNKLNLIDYQNEKFEDHYCRKVAKIDSTELWMDDCQYLCVSDKRSSDSGAKLCESGGFHLELKPIEVARIPYLKWNYIEISFGLKLINAYGVVIGNTRNLGVVFFADKKTAIETFALLSHATH